MNIKKLGLSIVASSAIALASPHHSPSDDPSVSKSTVNTTTSVSTTYNTNVITSTLELTSSPSDISAEPVSLQPLLSATTISADKIDVIQIPFSKKFDKYILMGSISHIDNGYTDKNGVGDSTIGIGYEATSDGLRSITSLSVGLPTGDIVDGTGTGAVSFTLAQSLKKSITNDSAIIASLSLSDAGESNQHIPTGATVERKMEYGSKYTAFIGYEKLIGNFLLKTKVSRFVSQSDTKKFAKDSGFSFDSLDNKMTLDDLHLSVGYNVYQDFYVAAGAVIPIADSYGDGVSKSYDRETVTFVTLTGRF
jgi:hypothetical protein